MANKLLSNEKENLEDLTIIWLDKNSQDLNIKTRLCHIINFLKIFTELNSCLEYIQSIPNEHIFIIVSGQYSSELIPFIQDLPQILHIYIFCQYLEKYSSLKSSGIFTNQELLYNQLSKDVSHFYATHSTTIRFLTEKSLRDLTKETGAFFWFQLFINALVDMPPSDEAKQDFLKLAREFYANNDLELRRIDRFDQIYEKSEALKWYSSDSFVYRLLNKAIRTENIDLLFSCRFFIIDLYHQLELLHKPYVEFIHSCKLNEFIVYHGQQMTSNDFNKLKANIGKFISINSFLSTSKTRQIALIYAGDRVAHPNMESVLFQIKININETLNTYKHPFGDISEFSNFKEEQEVLFSLAAMFRIESITEQLDSIWVVNMVFIESTTETEEMRELSTHLGLSSGQKTTMADLAYLLFLMNDYDRAISFCRKILNEISDNWAVTVRCYNIMGQAYRNEPKLALPLFENALKLQLQHNPNDFRTLATIYNNMGWGHRRLASATHLIVDYYEKALQMCTTLSNKNQTDWCLMATILNNLVSIAGHDDHDLALERERFVLEIRLKYLPLSHPLIATTHNTLAEVYITRGEFEEALVHSNEALRLTLKYLPNGHSSIAHAYSSEALIYLYKGDYEILQGQKEISEKSYNKSLELIYQAFDVLSFGESSSSTDHGLIAFLYNNCGVVYTRLGRFDEALDCFNISTDIIVQHLPSNHDLHGASLKNKGKIFTLQGNMSKGMEYYNQAMEFYNRIGQSNSVRIAQIYFNIGECYELSEQKDFAIKYYEHAIEIGVKIHKPNHPFLLQYTKALDKVKNTTVNDSIDRRSFLSMID